MGVNHMIQTSVFRTRIMTPSLLGHARWRLERDPFDIIYNNTTNIVESIEGFNLADFFYLIKSVGVIGGLLSIGVTLLAILFVDRSDAAADKKKDIEHKLFILFIIFSLITIFNVMKDVFDLLFFV